jgi:hypothetical protein
MSRYSKGHYEDVAGILRDALTVGKGDHFTIARIAFQFEHMFSADAPDAFNRARFIRAIFPEGAKR